MPLEPLPLRGTWDLFEPDRERFPALGLAYRAGELGGVAPAVLNAADEVAVAAFLDGRIRFPEIARVLAGTLDRVPAAELGWEAIAAADAEARRVAEEMAGE